MFYLKNNPNNTSEPDLSQQIAERLNREIENQCETMKESLLKSGTTPEDIETLITIIQEKARLQLLKIFEDELKKLALKEKAHSSSESIRDSAHPSNKTRGKHQT